MSVYLPLYQENRWTCPSIICMSIYCLRRGRAPHAASSGPARRQHHDPPRRTGLIFFTLVFFLYQENRWTCPSIVCVTIYCLRRSRAQDLYRENRWTRPSIVYMSIFCKGVGNHMQLPVDQRGATIMIHPVGQVIPRAP